MINAFLAGFIAALAVAAALCFVQFWRRTRDRFFLWFAAAFLFEALAYASHLTLARPNEGGPLVHAFRLLSFAMILIAIVRKNLGSRL